MEANDNDLSPLDQIRQTEAEVTRQIAAARESAKETINQAKKQVQINNHEARTLGQHKGQMLYKEILTKAKEDASAQLAQAHTEAKELRRKGKNRMEAAFCYAVQIVLGEDKFQVE